MQPSRKPLGLFLNPAKANCSIYESGRMMYDSLVLSDKYDLHYQEVDENSRSVPTAYDFYAFNYHHVTMGWLDTKFVSQLPGLKIEFVLEVSPDNPFVLTPSQDFDVYCVLDPTLKIADKRVYAFPRPLEIPVTLTPYREPPVPVIGSFGFATQGKGFELVVDAVNKEFDEAIVKINIPPATYADNKQDYAEYLIDLCKKTAKEGVQVVISRDYMTKEELIEWCGQNSLNCFLYNRNMPGLSATTDQAVSSGRPLALSDNATFRHLTAYIKPYPFRSLKESIAVSQAEVLQIQKDWAPENFAKRFEQVLADFKLFHPPPGNHPAATMIELKVKPQSKRNKIKLNTILGEMKMRIKKLISLSWLKKKKRSQLSPKPFISEALGSYSQFNEDLLIDLLFMSKKTGFYLDIGANDPSFNSNTRRFYDKGWSGINIEPGVDSFKKFCVGRTRDINLNVGVGPVKGTLSFYQVVGDSTLSSFDIQIAKKMAERFGLTISEVLIDVLRLVDVFENHVEGKQVDFMSVDAEGLDLEILKSNDWNRFRPSLIMVEIDNQYQEIIEYMNYCNYKLIFNNNHNGIFIDEKTCDENLKKIVNA